MICPAHHVSAVHAFVFLVVISTVFALPSSEFAAEESRSDRARSHRWQLITYPPIPVPEAEEERFTAFVGSGRGGEKTQLLFYVLWVGGPNGHPPALLANTERIVVRLHMPDGKVVAPTSETGWIAVGTGPSTSWSLTHTFPWGQNALEEGWFRLELNDHSYWLEVPYGFTRNPADQLAPALPNQDTPVFAPAMKDLPAEDRIVTWDSVEYKVGEIGEGFRLGNQQHSRPITVFLSNPSDAVCRLKLYGVSDLHTPRSSVEITQNAHHRVVAPCVGLAYDESFMSRIDTFVFKRNTGDGRDWGKLTVKIGKQERQIVIPSSLFKYHHGISKPNHKLLIRAEHRRW